MTRQLLRIKTESIGVLEFYTDTILGWDIEGYGEDYCLCAILPTGVGYLIHYGTFSECHKLLNSIHQSLDINIIDIT
jgi:hypothetical protein